jgi:hypothetical protein
MAGKEHAPDDHHSKTNVLRVQGVFKIKSFYHQGAQRKKPQGQGARGVGGFSLGGS